MTDAELDELVVNDYAPGAETCRRLIAAARERNRIVSRCQEIIGSESDHIDMVFATLEWLQCQAADRDRLADELAKLRDALRKEAELYEKDGEPGPLGYNFWGWQQFAATLRKTADFLTRGEPK